MPNAIVTRSARHGWEQARRETATAARVARDSWHLTLVRRISSPDLVPRSTFSTTAGYPLPDR